MTENNMLLAMGTTGKPRVIGAAMRKYTNQ
jgi:hypothetical protein